MLLSSPLYLELIRDADRLYAIKEEWSQLWDEDSLATPFQSPEWLLPWWKNFAEGELFVTAIRRYGRLFALVPFYIYTHSKNGERQLLLLGAGTSDYLDGLFAERGPVGDANNAPLEMIAECILEHRQLWDVAYMQQLRAGSSLLYLADLLSGNSHRYPSDPCSILWTDGPGVLPAKLSKNVHYYRHRAEQQGKLEFEAATEEMAPSIFEMLIALHGQRWKARGEPGVLADGRVQRHHREAIPLLCRKNLLRLYILKIDESIVAIFYGLADPPHRRKRRIYYYLNGFHPDFGSLSPGTLSLAFALEAAKQEGAAAIDMLRGGEQYKKLWKAEFFPTYTVELHANQNASH